MPLSVSEVTFADGATAKLVVPEAPAGPGLVFLHWGFGSRATLEYDAVAERRGGEAVQLSAVHVEEDERGVFERAVELEPHLRRRAAVVFQHRHRRVAQAHLGGRQQG